MEGLTAPPLFEGLPAPPLFARQPVFTATLGVFGHELLYRQALASTGAVFADFDAATLTVVAGAFLWQPGDLGSGQKILVNFGRGTILSKAAQALPPERTVVLVDEGMLLDAPLLEELAALKADGYTIGLNGFQARPEAAPLLDVADIAVIDVLGRPEEELKTLLAGLAQRRLTPMARKVEDAASFADCKKLGFGLFQGYFFKRPEVVAGRRLASNEMARLRLLRLTQSDEPDEKALDQAIRSDLSLSYRLLTYLNSPLLGQSMPRLSIPRAVQVLGWKQLRNWLRVIALTDLSPTGKAEELSFLALQRARFFELTAKGLGNSPQDAENLFTLGLFSLLDALLQSPMEELVGKLPLDEAVKDSLVAGKGPFATWLDMARSFEQGDWPGLEKALAALGVPAELAAGCYGQAMEFASAVKRVSS